MIRTVARPERGAVACVSRCAGLEMTRATESLEEVFQQLTRRNGGHEDGEQWGGGLPTGRRGSGRRRGRAKRADRSRTHGDRTNGHRSGRQRGRGRGTGEK